MYIYIRIYIYICVYIYICCCRKRSTGMHDSGQKKRGKTPYTPHTVFVYLKYRSVFLSPSICCFSEEQALLCMLNFFCVTVCMCF